jgi:rifampicin phosphotransferase
MDFNDLTWEAPGPGEWNFDPVHWPKPVSRVMQEVFPASSHRGWAPGLARYGVPVDAIAIAFCNDHLYLSVAPVTDADEVARRDAAARRAQESAAWVGDAELWERELRPARRAANFALQDVDMSSLDDGALAMHVEAAIANMASGITEHFSLVEVAGQGVGHLLRECANWGIAAGDAMALLAGCSPGSSDAAFTVARLGAIVRAARGAPRTLAEIRGLSNEAALTLDAFLREHGWRILTGYDVEDTVLAEHDDTVMRTILAAANAPSPGAAVVDPGTLRAGVPASDHPRFDKLVEEARVTYGVRDDNEGLTLMWPTGLVRRALLEAGRRLVRHGALRDEGHVFVANRSELSELLRGRGPSAAELAQRDARRRAAAVAPPPATLTGAPRSAPPALPEFAAKAMAALDAAFAAEWDTLGAVTAEGVVGTGVGVGTGSHRGRACVAATLEDAIARLTEGDVLVTPLTSSAFNAVLPLAGALVVEAGGPFCHAAIVARELGLPAVIGAAGAMNLIRDGDDVLVDAAAGRIQVLNGAAAAPSP